MATNPPQLDQQQLAVFVKHLSGYPKWRIALELGLADEVAVDRLLAQPALQAALADARNTLVAKAADLHERLVNLSGPALDMVQWIMDNAPDLRVRLNAAQDILDRAGIRAPERVRIDQRVQSFNTHALSDEDRQALYNIAAKAAKESHGS